jgi:hypothetical protein
MSRAGGARPPLQPGHVIRPEATVDRPVDTPADDNPHEPDDPANYRMPTTHLVLVIVLLALPVVALMWVSSYAKAEPTLWGFPFFFWYQFLWVFLAAICTSIAYQFVAKFRRRRRGETSAR